MRQTYRGDFPRRKPRPELNKKRHELDFVSKRPWFFLISLVVLVPGILFLAIAPGVKPGIDFTGGSATTMEFSAPVEQQDLRVELAAIGHPDAVVQRVDETTFFVRTKELSGASVITGPLGEALAPITVESRAFDLVSPVVAFETVRNAFWAVLAAAVGIFIYVWWAFRNVPSPFRYGTAAIVALVHDAMIVLGIFAILGELFDVEVNTMFLIALLTVIGYSVNDTIVVFDRLRENVLLYPNRGLEEIANLSISETLGRSLNTSLTLMFTLLALLLFGGSTIRVFLWVLAIGVVAGTYSSIAVATQVLIVWETRKLGRFFGSGRAVEPAEAG